MPGASPQARFSPCGRYRWWLERCWDAAAPRLLFIGLNPSRADGARDDPTLRRLVGFARAGGFGALEVLNLFAAVSPSPAVLKRLADPVGGANDRWIRRRLAAWPEATLGLGWGAGGGWRGRDRQVLRLLAGRRLLVLGLTRGGQPRHPLYLPAAARWREAAPLVHPEDALSRSGALRPCQPVHGATPSTCT
ncbi:DUF1643 domain-containing protein [Cyanobium sp. CH-040]|uniref:DUF1643 domain-containing protein n=1 Tax=Cyanobium sp. CH-040 TaxID=2823708 RepID=UPI0020CC716A|nr:DUF1643 domain-containing protein [Cyanobium sp. CH-040]MCP9927869.1 DUF1643 domain-containing protein [Cyanobium sp. CH-040]